MGKETKTSAPGAQRVPCLPSRSPVQGGLPEALTTFSCPVPFWGQRPPKETPQTRNSSKINQGPRGFGQETEQENAPWRGSKREVGRKGERKVRKLPKRGNKAELSLVPWAKAPPVLGLSHSYSLSDATRDKPQETRPFS